MTRRTLLMLSVCAIALALSVLAGGCVPKGGASSAVPDYLLPVATAQFAPLDGLYEGSAEAQELQKQWVKQGYPLEVVLKGTDLVFRLVPPGEFIMGADGDPLIQMSDRVPKRPVVINKPFYIGKYEVTQAQWAAVMGANPSLFNGGPDASLRPVESIRWRDTRYFLDILRERAGSTGLRLPTEAEWEYACRAGTTGNRYGELDTIAWFENNSTNSTQPVGTKQANAWGMHDMVGNVIEWCEDNRLEDGKGVPADSSAWLGGDVVRVSRGGSYRNSALGCSLAIRVHGQPYDTGRNFGLRLAVEVE